MALGFKTGGRKAGTPNKKPNIARVAIQAFVDNNADRAQALFERVAEENPADALKIYFSAVEYVVPKLARTENTTEITGNLPAITVEIVRPNAGPTT